MHELSIAIQIVETLEADLAENPGNILAVCLDLGVLSDVKPDALRAAWEVACEGASLPGRC